MKQRGRPKKIYVQEREGERDFLEGPQEEADIHRKVLRQGKTLVFSKDTYLEKERVWSKVTPRKVSSGIEAEGEIE